MKLLIIITYLLLSINAAAQQKDSLQTMQRFINACNAYKQVPMYLSLQYTTASNFITSSEDSSTAQAEFYITAKGGYIKFGELEQLVNDSMALLISGKMQRMILYTHAGAVIEQMKKMIGMQMPDSSVKSLCNKYRVNTKRLTNEAESIVLESRNVLYNTALPKETIELQYNTVTKAPLQVISKQRNLIPVQQNEYNDLISQKKFEGRLFRSGENYYAVKEKTTGYTYLQITHDATINIPVSFDGRVIKNDEGRYIPAKAYENYVLTEEQ